MSIEIALDFQWWYLIVLSVAVFAGILVFEDTPIYDLWLKLIIGGTLALTFILGIVFIYQDTEASLALFGITLFDALIFKAVLPHRFQIYQDRVRISLGGPFAVNIPLSDIRTVSTVSARKVFIYWGNRLATSTHSVVEIVRKKGSSFVISPVNRDMFIEQLNQALSQNITN